jgi:hypothetical protein
MSGEGFRGSFRGKRPGGWWTKNVKASPEVGSIAQFRFNDRGFNDMRVLELSPGKRVRWQCVDGAPEWIGTELTFDLREEKGVTVVLFAQRGWCEQVEFMHYCSTKWGTYLLSLKSLCENGEGNTVPGGCGHRLEKLRYHLSVV